MTRFKFVLAAGVVAAIVALVAGAPAAQAQASCQYLTAPACAAHFVGGGSSAQWQMAAIAADQAALTEVSATGTGTVQHWTKKFKSSTGDGAYLGDSRHSGIFQQTGNVWVVWIQNSTGGVTDVWLDVSVDSTVGVRCALAQQSSGPGCNAFITSSSTVAGDNAVAGNLWPDGIATDDNMNQNLWNAINLSATGGLHVNVGLTDIRPEDAEFATKRLICNTRTTSTSCLGDPSSPNVANIGGKITSNQGTNAFAQPVGFALPGEADPFTHTTVATTFVTYPIGAAPIVFIANNGGTALSGSELNLVSGVTPAVGDTKNGQKWPLATLFDGSTSCDTSNVAFGGNGSGSGTALTLFLREPLSGTMNTTEFSLFRTTGNTTDSQEGSNAAGSTAMNFAGGATGTGTVCNGSGLRSRAIGTGEVVGATSGGTNNAAYGVLGTSDSLGYIFTGWGNLAKFKGGTSYQYLTLDQVDPLFAAPTAYSTCQGGTSPNNDGAVCGSAEACTAGTGGTAGTCTAGGSASQTIPYCSTTSCTSDLWPAYSDPNTGYTQLANATYPNVRNGMYLAWSIYRWVADSANTDPYGPVLVSQEAQNYVDGDVADFVPFSACAPATGNSCLTTTGPTDGLDVYRSHFKPAGITEVCPTSTDPDNGAVSHANNFDNGNTLGGGPECGGDVGGEIFGPFGTTGPSVTWITWTTTLTPHDGYKVTYKTGDKFTAANPAQGSNVTVICTNSSGVQSVTDTTVEKNTGGASPSVYLTVPYPTTGLSDSIECKLVDSNLTHAAATSPGTLSKHQ